MDDRASAIVVTRSPSTLGTPVIGCDKSWMGNRSAFVPEPHQHLVDGWYARHEMVLSSDERCYSRGNECLFICM